MATCLAGCLRNRNSLHALSTTNLHQNYGTIQDAINVALPGDTIHVPAGTYFEHLTINKSITIIGENLSTTILDGNKTGVLVEITASNVGLSSFSLRNADEALRMTGVSNCEISNNRIFNISGYYGVAIHATDCENITIQDNYSTDIDMDHVRLERTRSSYVMRNCFVANKRFSQPILLYYCEGNVIGWNQVLKEGLMNEGGIGLLYSDRNTICYNTIVKTDWAGISLLSSNSNTIEGNTISGITWNSRSGALRMDDCTGGSVYNNNFVTNSRNVFLLSTTNTTWTRRDYGNYWDDYNGKDAESDGIGDTPYIIDATNNDTYPLMGRFHHYEVSKQNVTFPVQLISNSTINDLTYSLNATYPEGMFELNVSGNQAVKGFCLLVFPRVLIAPPYNVTINGEPPILSRSSADDEATLYFAYPHGDAQNNIIVTSQFSIRVPQDYPTIQDAISAANPGDLIYVLPGTYNTSFTVNKGRLRIIGEDRLTTTIDLSEATSIRLVAENTSISGFTIRNSRDPYALYVESNGNTISNTIFESNAGGVYCGFEDDSKIVAHNSIRDNEFRNNSQVSLYLNLACQNIIFQNNFSNNHMGILVYSESANNTISSNRLSNTRSICITTRFSPGSIVCNNYINSGTVGIFVDIGSDNSTVSENELVNVQGLHGVIYLISTNNVVVRSNFLLNNSGGIYLDHSCNALVSNNTMRDNKFGLGVHGEQLPHFMHMIDSSNRINGKPIYYMINRDSLTINASLYSEIGFLGIINCTRVKIDGIHVSGNWQGLLLACTTGSEIKNTTLSQCFSGIDFYQSSNNSLFLNNIFSNSYGIRLLPSSRNAVYKNNFINNTNKPQCSEEGCAWDNGAEGNFWSDYQGQDLNQDGLGDVAYTINSNNSDRYPLMGSIAGFDVGVWDEILYQVELVSNATVTDFGFNADGRFMKFNVKGENSTTGFCRVTINYALLGGPYTVFVGTTQVNPMATSNLTHSFLYFTTPQGTQSVSVIGETAVPEFASATSLFQVFLILSSLVSLLVFVRATRKLED
jgi:parallel beta-helix repeat protein